MGRKRDAQERVAKKAGRRLQALLDGEPVRVRDDSVNHPSHYNRHPSGVECIVIVEHMTFNAGNAVKYAWRAGLKGNESSDALATHIEDLKKGRWYLDREIARLEKAGAT